MSLRIIDGNNYYRRMLEACGTGSSSVPRNLLGETERAPGVVVWAWDGFGAKKRRQDIYPAYKSKRLPPQESIYEGQKFFQGLLLHSKAIQIRVPEYEGDDTIGTLVRKYGASQQIDIISNDKDLLQLEGPNVRCDRAPVPGVCASDIRLWKTLTGDSSDCITGIPGFGDKAWEACNQDAFRDLLQGRTGSLWAMSEEGIQKAFEVKPGVAKWLNLIENEAQLRIMWTIIGLYEVPWELVSKNTVLGKSDPAVAEAMLGEFLQ
jgi:5'-3' exonuclease